jgi:hypothetical protein
MRGGKGASAVLVVLAAVLTIAGPTTAARPLSIQTSIEPGGRVGSLHVDSAPGSISWEACDPKLTRCRPWSRGVDTDTLRAPAETVFRVRNGSGETGISPEWRGPLKELAPPRVSGDVRANAYVSPVPGLWSGGWSGESPEMQLAACEGGAGTGCVSITSPRFIREGCGLSASYYLNPIVSGWYLRVADTQSGGPHAVAGYAVRASDGRTWGFDQVWGRSPTVSAAIVGQIAPAVSPPAGECGPPPAPAATISAEGVARVECGGGCSAVLVARRGGRRQAVSREVGAQNLLDPQAALEMRLGRAALDSLGAGKALLTVEVDGTRLARRTVHTSGS